MLNRYAQGYEKGRADAKEDFERLLGVLREELATKANQLVDAMERADRATDALLGVLGSRAVSTPGLREYERRVETEANFAKGANADPFAELPIGDPNGTFQTIEQAMIPSEE